MDARGLASTPPLSERLRDGIRARLDRLAETLLFESRADALADDVVRLQIGERAARALARLDADPALGGSDDEQNAVVRALLADASRR